MHGHKNGPIVHSQPQSKVFSIDVNDFNSSSHLYPINNNNKYPSSSSLPAPTIGLPRTKIKSGFKFNRCFLIVPLIAFLLVAIAATVFGVIFGVMYQPTTNSDLIKNNNETSKIQTSTKLQSTSPVTLTTVINLTTNVLATTTNIITSPRLGKLNFNRSPDITGHQFLH